MISLFAGFVNGFADAFSKIMIPNFIPCRFIRAAPKIHKKLTRPAKYCRKNSS